jgi:dGTPase
MQRTARQVVRELFAVLLEQPDCLPPDWQARVGAPGAARTAEAIADYIAGMTDRFALDEHERLFTLAGSAR